MRLVTALPLILLLVATNTQAREHTFSIVSQASGQPVPDAIVIAESAPADPVESEIVQKDRAFHPGLLVVPRGSVVHFPNRDNTQHHVYSFSPAKTFDIELYADQPEAPITFDQAGVVELGCNIHDHMQGFVIVTDQASWGRSDEQGQVTLDLAKPAPVALRIWHQRLADNTRMLSRSVDLTQEGPVELSLELTPAASANSPMERLQNRFEDL